MNQEQLAQAELTLKRGQEIVKQIAELEAATMAANDRVSWKPWATTEERISERLLRSVIDAGRHALLAKLRAELAMLRFPVTPEPLLTLANMTEAWLDTNVRCPHCGGFTDTVAVIGPHVNEFGTFECPNCGTVFNPLHSSNRVEPVPADNPQN